MHLKTVAMWSNDHALVDMQALDVATGTHPQAVAMRSNDDMLARLHSGSNGFQPEGQESVHGGLQGLSQR